MKRAIYIVVLISALLALGCSRDEVPESPKEKVRVVLSGSMDHGTAQSRADGMINPVDASGLPPEQLEIGILTIENVLDFIPAVEDWNDPATAYLDRGFFGGNVPGDSPTGMENGWNGNIEYTNRDGDALQTVFYDEMGVFYYLVAFYPYHAIHVAHVEDEGESMILDEDLGATVIFNVNGSQDIMSTQLGKGNIEPENRLIDPLVFKHRLTCLQCDFFAESSVAAGLYGDIVSVELVEQPDKLGLNIGVSALDEDDPIFDVETADIGVDVSYIGYPAVRPWVSDGVREEDPLPLPATYVEGDAVEFGYILAKSARKYKFKIVTSGRGEINPLYVTYDFDPGNTGNSALLPKPGYIYHLTFKMLESAEITLIAGPVTERWIDQRFD